jgi:hypothetical protein
MTGQHISARFTQGKRGRKSVLARFPATWNHVADKNSRQATMPEQILVAKTIPSWQNLL